MKKVYIDFEMNMPDIRGKRYILNIEELTKITSDDLINAPTYEEVMRSFKAWLGKFSEIKGIYTFGNLDLTCFSNIDKISSQKYKHPRFLNNIRNLFVDIKCKYLSLGIRCMNYISLKNLLSIANVEFSGEVHDPLDDAYNLYLLDSVLDDNKDIRDLLTIKDIIKPPFINIDEELEDKFEKYKNYFYKRDTNYDIDYISKEIILTIRLYILSLLDIDINDIEVLNDISKKIKTIEKLNNINDGYFYILENVCLDMIDLLEDLMLYKIESYEYKDEIKEIVALFEEDLKLENILY